MPDTLYTYIRQDAYVSWVYRWLWKRYTRAVTFVMDYSKKSHKRSTGSMDGFVRPNGAGNRPVSSLSDFNQYYSGSKKPSPSSASLRIGSIDNFRSPEGFTPSAQAPLMNPAARNKPAELGNVKGTGNGPEDTQSSGKPPKKRRGFLHFRRKPKKPKKTHKHPKLRIAYRTAGALVLIVVLVGGGLTLKAYLKSRKILKGGSDGAVALNKTVDPTLLKGEGDGRVNILVLGKGGPGHEGPDLTDTLLVASIDPVAKETALLSIPRDLWVKSENGQSKINSVYANAKYRVLNNYTTKQQTAEIKQQAENAGIKAIESTISNVIGIPLQYYVMVDFEAFRQSIDAVGGIDVNVTTELYDPSVAWENNNNPLIAAVGMQHFDGKKALLYSRSRHGSLRGDFDRTERQREVIVALRSKVLSLGTFANPLKVNQLIDAFGDHVSTDFTLNEIMRVYDLTKNIDPAKIQSIGLADPPNDYVTTDNVNNQSVVRPRAGLFDYSAIQSYIRNTLRDSFLKSENANVIVLNGTTTAGLATLKSTELKSFGYNVTEVADAPTKDYTKTVLVDLTKGVKKYTKNYLEKRLNVTAVTTLPDTTITTGTADFVIILGSNESSAE